MSTTQSSKPDVSLVASTDDSNAIHDRHCHGSESFIKSLQWSADGTTVFTSSSDNTVSSYVLPEDLLQSRDNALSLRPQETICLPEPTNAVAPCPYFSLSAPYTHLILTAAQDRPIQLHQALHSLSSGTATSSTRSPGGPPNHQPPPLASYPLIHAPTESHEPTFSLLWPSPGTHFLAGTKNAIACFDVARSCSGAGTARPLLRVATIPSARHRAKGGGVGMRGTVSALAASPASGVVAAGTWTRWVGLYDFARAGGCVANWGVAAAADAGPGGRGIMQTLWSPCGRYLVVNERRAAGLLVYDVRVAGRLLGWLAGRDGDTQQRLTCDAFAGSSEAGESGFEVWAGTRTGDVVVWEGIGNDEGRVAPSWDWKACDSAVGSTGVHLSGSVVATCSGSWRPAGECVDEDETGEQSNCDPSRPRLIIGESSLKVWRVGAGALGDGDPAPE